MITKYQAMSAAIPLRGTACEVQAVEDRLITLRHTIFMLNEMGMLTDGECRSLAKPLYALEEQVYQLLCNLNDAELYLVRHAQQSNQQPTSNQPAYF